LTSSHSANNTKKNSSNTTDARGIGRDIDQTREEKKRRREGDGSRRRRVKG